MLFGAAHPAASPAGATPTRVLPDLVQVIAGLFEITRPAAGVQALHLWWLAAVVTGGAIVRFWGLGGVGLHGDEETMAMAVRHILVDGQPILPSGMFYPRAMTQLYAMALSLSIFGESEWALRLPSALCGVALIGFSFAVGRRFLRPQWNLALATTVAFLPALIVDSQTARMYIFVVTCVMASLACLFEWERTDRAGWLIVAVLVLVVGIDMHLLAVAVAPIFLLPGLLRGDMRKCLYGAAAMLAAAAAFVAIEAWSNAQYPVPPPEFAADLGTPAPEGSRAVQEFALTFDIAIWAVGLMSAFLAVRVARAIPARGAAVASIVLLLAGVGLQLILFYHLAALSYLFGVVLARRYGSARVTSRIAMLVVACGLLALIHVAVLASAHGSIIKLVGALVGQPSVWPYVRVAQLSPAAGVLTCALLAWGLYRLAHNRRASDYWLLAVLGVWAPVFAVGLFAWNVPTRYTAMSLAPMLLCAFAFAQRAADWLVENVSKLRRLPQALAAALTAVCAIDPLGAATVIDAGYRIYPDHKGAAEFMRSQRITDEDLVLAEDVLQQTYYLGKVDYWLIGKQVARRYVKRATEGNRSDGVVDFYTGTPVIATRAMLDELLQDNPDKRIFIIGSGEGQRDRRRGVRGAELHAAIESDRFETLYVGRDGLTRVLRAVPGRVAPSAETSTKSDADAKSLATAVPPASPE